MGLDNSWVGWGRVVVGHTLILDISHIAGVGVGHIVGHNLGPAVWEGDAVLSVCRVPVPVFILTKVCLGVVVSNCVLIGIDCWAHGLWSVGNRSGMGHQRVRSNDRPGGMGNGCGDHWGDSHGHWLVGNNWCRMGNHRVGNDWGWVIGGRSVDHWHMSRGVNSCAVLLSSVGVVHILGSGVGLLGNYCSVGSVGLMDRVAHSRSVPMLNDLMVGLVCSNSGQESRDSDESLKFRVYFPCLDNGLT